MNTMTIRTTAEQNRKQDALIDAFNRTHRAWMFGHRWGQSRKQRLLDAMTRRSRLYLELY
jgi:hypothetical protein